MTKVVMHDGKLINVGPWDECLVEETTFGNPWEGDGPLPWDWDLQPHTRLVATNPIPEGAYEDDCEVVESDKGRLLLSSDWHTLREDAYPSLKEQLGAFWKGGEDSIEMAQKVQAVKDRYPKPQ